MYERAKIDLLWIVLSVAGCFVALDRYLAGQEYFIIIAVSLGAAGLSTSVLFYLSQRRYLKKKNTR